MLGAVGDHGDQQCEKHVQMHLGYGAQGLKGECVCYWVSTELVVRRYDMYRPLATSSFEMKWSYGMPSLLIVTRCAINMTSPGLETGCVPVRRCAGVPVRRWKEAKRPECRTRTSTGTVAHVRVHMAIRGIDQREANCRLNSLLLGMCTSAVRRA